MENTKTVTIANKESKKRISNPKNQIKFKMKKVLLIALINCVSSIKVDPPKPLPNCNYEKGSVGSC